MFFIYEKMNCGIGISTVKQQALFLWQCNSQQVWESLLKTYCQAKILLCTRCLGSSTISMSGNPPASRPLPTPCQAANSSCRFLIQGVNGRLNVGHGSIPSRQWPFLQFSTYFFVILATHRVVRRPMGGGGSVRLPTQLYTDLWSFSPAHYLKLSILVMVSDISWMMDGSNFHNWSLASHSATNYFAPQIARFTFMYGQ